MFFLSGGKNWKVQEREREGGGAGTVRKRWREEKCWEESRLVECSVEVGGLESPIGCVVEVLVEMVGDRGSVTNILCRCC